MRIEFPLLSALSTILLICLYMLGGVPSMDGLCIDVNVSGDEVRVGVHPTFICTMDTHNLFNGMCFGNVIVLNSQIPNTHMPRLLAHEARHLEHWKALGLWVWAAQYILPLENTFADWGDPSIELAEMWSPPDWWTDQWSFIKVFAEI